MITTLICFLWNRVEIRSEVGILEILVLISCLVIAVFQDIGIISVLWSLASRLEKK